jgi:nucleotide-binding universal stress UspA family protein
VSADARPAPTLIGVGVDGEPGGRDAVALALLLAPPSTGELMLIAVHEEPLVQVPLPRGLSWATLEEQAREMLCQTRDALAPGARIVVRSDALVWRGLRHVVRTEHRDLLVVGSSHHARDGHTRLGRSAGELAAHLDCPLAIASSGLRNHGRGALKRIGVGLDRRPEARAALAVAASIASVAGAELEVRAVVDDVVPGGLRTEEVVLDGDAIIDRQLASTFEEDLAVASASGVPTRLEVLVGDPTDVLRELCEAVDLLVLGSGHRGASGRVQLGSVGNAIVYDAGCSILLTPRPASS